MAQRSECLYKDEIIGIESIYTVINGKQINIPEKVESLRKKGRERLLTCPCGCKAKLILVAGDKNLREQHFRIQEGTIHSACTLKQEGQTSIDSKIVIKCWLNDKLKTDIITRLPLNKICNNDRKYEISHISIDKKLAINYTNTRLNLNDEKFKEIYDSLTDYAIYNIVDIANIESTGQYPEFMMKIQDRQKYCLFLEINGRDYSKAKLTSAFYYKKPNGFYILINMTEGNLSEYEFNKENKLLYKNQLIDEILILNKKDVEQKLEEERIAYIKEQERRKQEYLKREKYLKKSAEEHRKLELKKQEEENIRKSNEIKRKLALEEQEKEVRVKLEIECKEKAEKEIDNYISNEYVDVLGRPWYKCEICGKVGHSKEFGTFGGVNKAARGICNDCMKKRSSNINFEIGIKVKTNSDNNYCPECGSELVKRNGKYGEFFGCSSYPFCKYTRNLSK